MMQNNGKRSIALIPCYNEELTIATIILKTKDHVDEVLVIDDGSTDDTAKIAAKAGATVIAHKINKGKAAGIKTGFKYALANKYDYVVTLDGDAQHNPNEIPMLLDSIKENGHDIILGIRYGKNTEMPLWRKFGKRVLDYTTSFGNGGIVTDSQCGFRVFNRNAVEKITPKITGDSFSVESEQLIRAHELGLKTSCARVSCKYKELDCSTKGPTSHGFSVLRYILKVIAVKHPLLFIGIPGLISVLIGLFLGIRTLQMYNITNVFNIGYAIIVAIFLIVGVIAMFIALTLNVLPQILKRSLEEEI